MSKKKSAATAATATASKRGQKKIVKASEPANEIVIDEVLTEEIVNEEIVNEPTNEIVNEIVNEKSSDTTLTDVKDPVKEAQEIVNDRKVRVFWHKACVNEKETTLTQLKASETLKKTDAKVSLTNPEFVDAEKTPNELPTIIKDVYSLKRGKRIYYLHDVTPTDITRAEEQAVKIANEKAAEAKAKETSK